MARTTFARQRREIARAQPLDGVRTLLVDWLNLRPSGSLVVSVRIAAGLHVLTLLALAPHLRDGAASTNLMLLAATLIILALSAGGAPGRGSARDGVDGPGEVHTTAAASKAKALNDTVTIDSAHSKALMARVSHELRTPLNAVLGFSDLMAREFHGPLGNSRYQEYAGHINDSGRSLLKSAEDTIAITALLTDGRLRTAPTAIDLDSLALEAWSFYAAEAGRRGITLELRTGRDIEVLGDRRVLRQILINVFHEALARARDCGTVILSGALAADLFRVGVDVGSPTFESRVQEESLAICLARTMLELQGMELQLGEDSTSLWQASVLLPRSVQRDFFAA